MKLFSLFLISVTFGLLLGFLVGRSSDERLRNFGLDAHQLIVLTTHPEIFDDKIIKAYKGLTGFLLVPEKVNNIDELFIKQSKASIFLVPSNWIENKSWSSKVIEDEELIKNTVSPDFLTLTHQESHTIPYLWTHKTEKNFIYLEILSLYYPERIDDFIFKESIQGLLDPDLVEDILNNTNYSTTLMTLDNHQITRNKKSLSVRDLELKKIKIDHLQ